VIADMAATFAGPAARLVPAGGGDSDRVEITTVGIDVGSATFHLSFSRVLLQRRAQELSTRYEVVARDTLWSSPVAFTPYCGGDDTIDADAVATAVTHSYQRAGVGPSAIDSGAVLLTGTALVRHNARALAERLAVDSGRFVCAAAGPHLEAILAAHGSGAVERSIAGPAVVAVDVGGGTTKLALAVDGHVRATAALAVGARLVAWDSAGRLTRVEPSVVPAAEQAGVRLTLGGTLAAAPADRLCERMAQAVVEQILMGGRGRGDAAPGADLLLTGPFPAPAPPFAIVVSGGVAEYLDDPGHAARPGSGSEPQ
jgi:ethanolamine utilization protein EutA